MQQFLRSILALLAFVSLTVSAQSWQHSTKTDFVHEYQREFIDETNDCVPVAVANALHVDYYTAIELCQDFLGRCPMEGVPVSAIIEGMRQLLDECGYGVAELYTYEGIPFTVGEFLPVLQDKTALVFIPGHALVIDHGVMVDWFVQTADAPVMFLLVVEKL